MINTFKKFREAWDEFIKAVAHETKLDRLVEWMSKKLGEEK